MQATEYSALNHKDSACSLSHIVDFLLLLFFCILQLGMLVLFNFRKREEKPNLKNRLKGDRTFAFTLQSNFPIHFLDKSEFIWPAVAFACLGVLQFLCLNCVY